MPPVHALASNTNRMGQDYGRTMGYCLILKMGRLVARNNRFVGGLCGVAVDPFNDRRATTVHLVGNAFSDVCYDWGW